MQIARLPGPDVRKDKRYNYYGNVTVMRSVTGAALPGQTVNLSNGGWLMRLHLPGDDTRLHLLGKGKTSASFSQSMMRDFGEGAVVDARFDSGYLSLLARARVCRSCDEGGTMALEFLHMNQRGRDELQKLILDLEDVMAGRPDDGVYRSSLLLDS